MAGDTQQRLKDALEGLSKAPGFVGATLITRDGLPVFNYCGRIPSPETYGAMSAAMLASAETALSEVGNVGVRRAIVETEEYKMIVVGVSDEHLLVGLGNGKVSLDKLLGVFESTAKDVAQILSG